MGYCHATVACETVLTLVEDQIVSEVRGGIHLQGLRPKSHLSETCVSLPFFFPVSIFKSTNINIFDKIINLRRAEKVTPTDRPLNLEIKAY